MMLALASALLAANRLDEAARHARRALEIIDANAVADAPERAVALQMLARCAYEGEHYEEALDWARRSLEVFRARLGPDSVQVAQTEMLVAHVLFETGRLDEARAQLQTVLATFERGGHARHSNAMAAWTLLARTELGLAHFHDALLAARQALDIAGRGDAPPPILASARCWLAIATLAEDGDVAKARAAAEPSIAVLRAAAETATADECERWLAQPTTRRR